jgi:glutamate--cysteine ligase catalytic subunit
MRVRGIILLVLLAHSGVIWNSAPAQAAILRVGTPLDFPVSRPHLQNVRLSGVEQMANHYLRCKGIRTPEFLWGDEVEYGIFRKQKSLSPGDKEHYDLSLRGAEIREYLNQVECDESLQQLRLGCNWTPEYGSWMVEAVPRNPYGGHVGNLFDVEKSMQLRRKRLHLALREDEIAPSMSNFPMLGVTTAGYSHNAKASGPIANSPYISDSVINPHPRFGALTKNIRLRRGSNVEIMLKADVPGSGDTPAELGLVSDNVDDLLDTGSNYRQLKKGEKDGVYMDAMAFGMGSCCLQVTMQCCTERESRFLHDQLIAFSPIYMALSAATPFYKGRFVDSDSRWDVISQSVDDRTNKERGLSVENRSDEEMKGLVKDGKRLLKKSRYSGMSRYIGLTKDEEDDKKMESLNDVGEAIDEESLRILKGKGVDNMLAKHIAHLFTRDPLVIFDDAIQLDNSAVLDHFDNVQSTNWNTVRWKAPGLQLGVEAKETSKKEFSGEDGPGWRVEFRPLELQLTDFENAAFSIFLVLLSRAILAQGFKFYMPISLVDENMARSQRKDAVTKEKFFFPKNAFRQNKGLLCDTEKIPLNPNDDEYVELSIDELFNGTKDKSFPGFIPVVLTYLDKIGTDSLTKGRLLPYINLLKKKASGEVPTTARWLREFVLSHPEYQKDGRLTPQVADDLIKRCEDIGMGVVQEKALLGDVFIENLSPSCCTDVEKRPFLADNYEALVASGVVNCARYVPSNSCSDDSLSDSFADEEKSKRTPYLESAKCD